MSVAVAVICKTPRAGASKTRLSPPLRPEDCAKISACFIQDLSCTIGAVGGTSSAYALYTPAGTEDELRPLLPNDFRLVLQREGDLGARLRRGIDDLLGLGHTGAILVNSDSPTLPRAIIEQAVAAVSSGDRMVISPAVDGGYTLIGLSRSHPRLFEDIPWSTDQVYRLTVERAREIGVETVEVDGWYDVDDASSFAMLQAELAGARPSFARPDIPLCDAPATRRFVRGLEVAST